MAILLFAVIYLYASPISIAAQRQRDATRPDHPGDRRAGHVPDGRPPRRDEHALRQSLPAQRSLVLDPAPGPSLLAVPVYLGVKRLRGHLAASLRLGIRGRRCGLPGAAVPGVLLRLCGGFAQDEWAWRLAVCASRSARRRCLTGWCSCRPAGSSDRRGSFVAAVTLVRARPPARSLAPLGLRAASPASR